ARTHPNGYTAARVTSTASRRDDHSAGPGRLARRQRRSRRAAVGRARLRTVTDAWPGGASSNRSTALRAARCRIAARRRDSLLTSRFLTDRQWSPADRNDVFRDAGRSPPAYEARRRDGPHVGWTATGGFAMAKGTLIAAMKIGRAAADEFHDWYDTEHLPERQRVPGFLLCQRFIRAEDRTVSLATYDLADVGVLKTPAYLAIGGE